MTQDYTNSSKNTIESVLTELIEKYPKVEISLQKDESRWKCTLKGEVYAACIIEIKAFASTPKEAILWLRDRIIAIFEKDR